MNRLNELKPHAAIVLLGAFLGVASINLATAPATAQTNLGHSGGQHLNVGEWHVELVGGIADTEFLFIVTDAKDKPVGLRRGLARVDNNLTNKLTKVFVRSDGSNVRSGELSRPLARGAKITITAETLGSEIFNAQFNAD